MAAPVTIHDFVGVLRRSKVVADEVLDGFLRERHDRWRQLNSPAQAAAMLFHGGLLSQFQAKHLLAGRAKGFWIKRYLVLEELGSGGMGRVFLCEQTPMNRLVAVKVLPSQTPAGALERFMREARASAALDHANIVRAFDVDHEDRFHFLVMEYVDGPTLAHLVEKQGPLAIGPACHYVAQGALGLSHAHDAGWIHRDVKPANLLVDRTGTVKLLDLGLARFILAADEELTKNLDDQSLIGTADYIAPELTLPDEAVDCRADIYSLGATLFYLLTGRPPYNEGSILQKLMAHQLSDPPLLTQLRVAIPAELAEVVQRMMSRKASRRPQTGEDVADELQPFLDGGPFPPEPRVLPVHCQRVRQVLGAAPAPASSKSGKSPKSAQSGKSGKSMAGLSKAATLLSGGSSGARLLTRRRKRKRLLLLGAAIGGGLFLLTSCSVVGWWGLGKLRGDASGPATDRPAIASAPGPAKKEAPPPAGVLTPQEAAQKIDQRCCVQFLVRRAALSTAQNIMFLNSEANYKADTNFTIVVQGIDRQPQATIADLPNHYQGKTVRATGVVVLFQGRPEIIVGDLAQVEIVADAKSASK
jgi:serine/threonine protein kinase